MDKLNKYFELFRNKIFSETSNIFIKKKHIRQTNDYKKFVNVLNWILNSDERLIKLKRFCKFQTTSTK